ncbi:hypothetical protein ACWJKU_03205 [Methylocaldum sp. MU1018]
MQTLVPIRKLFYEQTQKLISSLATAIVCPQRLKTMRQSQEANIRQAEKNGSTDLAGGK